MLGFQPRAYDPNAGRELRRDGIVYDANDLRRTITLCVNEQRPCVLRMGDNIAVGGSYGGGFTLPIGLKSFRIDGADRFKFVVTDDIPFLFNALGSASAEGGFPVEVANTDIVVRDGASIGTVFVVDQAASVVEVQQTAVSVRGVRVDSAGGSITNMFGLGSAVGAVGHIDVDGLQGLEVVNFFAADPSTSAWYFSRVQNVYLTGAGLTPATIGTGSGSVSIIDCLFSSVTGSIDVDTGVNSEQNLWQLVCGNNVGSFITNDPGGTRPQTLIRVSNFAAKSLSPGDKDLDL